MVIQSFDQWIDSVPQTMTDDPLSRMRVYRLALFAADVGWHDVSKLIEDRRTRSLADQLYRALGSIGANIAEGYSRSSGKDQARFYEYALGSARETRDWYYKARRLLGQSVIDHRLQLLTEIIRLLLTIIPAQRGSSLREESPTYQTDLFDPKETIPFS